MSFTRTSLLLTALSFTALADQHQDDEAGLFFMRVEWWLDGFDLPAFAMNSRRLRRTCRCSGSSR